MNHYESDIAKLVSELRLCVLPAAPFENSWWGFRAGFTDEKRLHSPTLKTRWWKFICITSFSNILKFKDFNIWYFNCFNCIYWTKYLENILKCVCVVLCVVWCGVCVCVCHAVCCAVCVCRAVCCVCVCVCVCVCGVCGVCVCGCGVCVWCVCVVCVCVCVCVVCCVYV